LRFINATIYNKLERFINAAIYTCPEQETGHPEIAKAEPLR